MNLALVSTGNINPLIPAKTTIADRQKIPGTGRLGIRTFKKNEYD